MFTEIVCDKKMFGLHFHMHMHIHTYKHTYVAYSKEISCFLFCCTDVQTFTSFNSFRFVLHFDLVVNLYLILFLRTGLNFETPKSHRNQNQIFVIYGENEFMKKNNFLYEILHLQEILNFPLIVFHWCIRCDAPSLLMSRRKII